jgi:predicted GNAT family N-acyltransferase
MVVSLRLIAHASHDYAMAVNLRRAVLRTPLGLDFTSAQLATEATDTHLAAFDGEDLIGTVVLSSYDEMTLKLRQMAVDNSHQGAGIGRQLLTAAEDHAKMLGKTRIMLAARVTAQPFYALNGYVAEGEIFDEVTIPHITMHKTL